MAPADSMPDETRAPHALSDDVLTPVYELNEQFLETLAQAARHPSWSGSSWHKALRLSVDGLSTQMHTSLSRVPICLVDLGLRDRSLQTSPGDSRTDDMPDFLARDRALELTRIALTLAWTFARTDLCTASIVFALPPGDAKALIAWRVHQLSDLANRLVCRIRPMWLGNPRIWTHVFTASETSTTDRLPGLRLRLLQRQLADLMLAPSASGSPRAFQR